MTSAARWPAPNRPAGPEPENPQLALLEDYRKQLVTTAKDAGLKAARRGDPDGFDLAVRTIRRLVREGFEVDADAVRHEVVIATNAIGAAFGFLSKRGEIRCVGYRVSTSPSRHGGLLRIWRTA